MKISIAEGLYLIALDDEEGREEFNKYVHASKLDGNRL